MVDKPVGLRVPYVRWNMGSGRIADSNNSKQTSLSTKCSLSSNGC